MKIIAIDPGCHESAWIKGVLCRRGHDAGDGTSLRDAGGHCVQCQKVVHARSKVKRKDRDRELARAWRSCNREHLATKQREYRAKNPARHAEYEGRRLRSPEQRAAFNAYRRRYVKANPEVQQAAYQRRRARLSENNTLTAADVAAQRERQQGICHYCSLPLDNSGRGHIDHKTPLSRGGFNQADNIVIACGPCNLRKGRKTAEEFLQEQNANHFH